MKNEPTVGSLFSGIGGIEIGFENEGFKTEWFIEKEPYAKEILKKRFSSPIIYEDITKVDFRTIAKVDILTGGFPCQDISNAGKGVGITGSRSSLWKYYFEAIRILRPRFALIENVSALTVRGLNVVLADLAKIGYDAEWYNISASAVGAFHQRERIFIIAYPNSNWKSDESFNEGERQGIMDELFNSNNNGQSSSKEQESFIERSNRSKTWESETSKSEGSSSQPRSMGQFPNTNQEELQGRKETRNIEESRKNREQQLTRQSGCWESEPELGRVANGISNRVDRIKCLGNAVVPQCAEVFAKAIKMISYNLNKTSEEKE